MEVTKGVSLRTPLSAGGMGEVWLADHHGLKTSVVVKFMLGGLDSSDSARTRFSREAAAAAQVKSPHVVQMLDHGVTDAGVPFIVMEHLEGHDLGDEIKRGGAIDPAKVVVIVSQIAKALTKVHAAGLLHRDIKPDNIFLCEGEEDVFAKLLDFGIAKNNALPPEGGSLDSETKTGQIVGTPFYMSPEQVTASKTLDHRSDLWALGVVAYEALTGTKPYDGPSFGALAVRIATGGPPKPTEANPALPPTVDEWFAKACAREARDRFGSAKEMADALRAVFEGVVSLPARVSSRSGEGRAPSTPEAEAVGLAATAEGDSLRKELARSEAGVSVGRTGPSGSGSKFVIPAALAIVALGAAAFTMQSRHAVKEPIATASAGTTAAPPVVSKAASESVLPIAEAAPAVDAGAAPAPSTHAAATTRAPVHTKPVASVTAKPSAEASAKPPTVKATASPDPLY
jgi:serine/threonine-protein kinase